MKPYTEEQINGIFDTNKGIKKYLETGPTEMYDKEEPTKNQKPKVKENLNWEDEFEEMVMNELSDIVEGFFGPHFDGERPDKKKLLQLISQAAELAIADDELVKD